VIRALVTDIEGTTTSLSFVKDVLFPYSRDKMAAFVRERAGDPEIAALLDRLRGETAGGTNAEVVELLLGYIAADRKDPVLKALQGRIWRHGYESGEFVAHVYPDVEPALRGWKQRGVALYVFSSGSVEAQQLLFSHTQAGDLSSLFSGWFDTRIGKKTDPEAYRAIAAAIGEPAENILFLSDTLAELDAARAAGFVTRAVDRDSATNSGSHRCARSFGEITHELP
jgi:enolase-phosphatase E1